MSQDDQVIDLGVGEAERDSGLRTGRRHTFRPPVNKVVIELFLDPDDESTADDIFTLYSTDEAETYRRSLTVKDDKIPGDERCTLEFTDVDPRMSYTLIIDPGVDEPVYELFSDVPYEVLKPGEGDLRELREWGEEDPEGEPEDGEGEVEEDVETKDETQEPSDEELEAEYNELLADAGLPEWEDEGGGGGGGTQGEGDASAPGGGDASAPGGGGGGSTQEEGGEDR